MQPGQLVETTAHVYAGRHPDQVRALTRLPPQSVGVVRGAGLDTGAVYLTVVFPAPSGRLFARVAPWLVQPLADDASS